MVFANFKNPVDQQHRITMRQDRANLVDVEHESGERKKRGRKRQCRT
jgi:hypothetical protein